MYCCSPPATTLSAAWEGGVSDGTIDGVRKRSVDFCEARRGRKAWRVVKGARRRVFSVSNQVGGERDVMELAGREGLGTRMTAVRWRVWDEAFDIGCWGLLMCLVNFSIASSVDDGCGMELVLSCKLFRMVGISQM